MNSPTSTSAGVVRVAAVQAEPKWLDLDAGVAQVVDLIADAAKGGAQLVDVGTAAPDEADLLRAVAGSLLLVNRTTVRDTAGRPWCNSYSRLRPDVSQVEFEVSVGER
jgi:hypothetical protein